RDGVPFESREEVSGRGARLPKDSILWSNRCLVPVSPFQPGKASQSVPPPPQAHNGPHRLNVLKQCAGVPEKTVKSELSRCGSDELQLIHRAVCEPQPQARMLKPSGAMSVSTGCFPRGLVMSKPSTLVAQAAWTPLKIFRIASQWTTESPVHEPVSRRYAG
ncbi:hypothetical protein CSPX01_12115, partial [Colletotrichum filicis]